VKLFRVANEAGPTRNVIATAVQVVIVWGIALGLLPALTVIAEDRIGLERWSWPGRFAIAAVLFVAGSAVGVWSAWVMAVRGRGTPIPFDAARELVIAGPYRVVRNPMALSAIVQMLGVAAAWGSLGCVGLAIAGAVVWHVVIRPPEEHFLADRFGEAYDHYRTTVPLWIPRPPSSSVPRA
jgi:protein-S-isoprenylcysteine O-methyltransferase Ste14